MVTDKWAVARDVCERIIISGIYFMKKKRMRSESFGAQSVRVASAFYCLGSALPSGICIRGP